jgi:hypothetical protein
MLWSKSWCIRLFGFVVGNPDPTRSALQLKDRFFVVIYVALVYLICWKLCVYILWLTHMWDVVFLLSHLQQFVFLRCLILHMSYKNVTNSNAFYCKITLQMLYGFWAVCYNLIFSLDFLMLLTCFKILQTHMIFVVRAHRDVAWFFEHMLQVFYFYFSMLHMCFRTATTCTIFFVKAHVIWVFVAWPLCIICKHINCIVILYGFCKNRWWFLL